MKVNIDSRTRLITLILMTVVPITLATLAYWFASSSGNLFGTVNHGNLISPPLDVTALDMRDEQGDLQFRSFEERIAEIENDDDYQPGPWLMVITSAGGCDETCEQRLHDLRQLHITLGADMPRLRRYFLHASPGPLEQMTRERFRERFPSMGLAFGDRQRIESRLEAGGLELDLTQDNYIFLVDPVGNVMMYYDSSHGLKEIQEDLERLLEYSSLG